MESKIPRTKIKVLLIDDDEDDLILTREYLNDIHNYEIELDCETDFDLSLEKILECKHDVYFIDYRLGKYTGIELLKKAKECDITAPLILLTGKGDWEIDFQATQLGAADYLVKDEINAQILERSIRYALNNAQIIAELDGNEKKYRTLFEKSIDPIFLMSNDFKITDVSPSMETFSGFAREELIGMELQGLFESTDVFEDFSSKLCQQGQAKDIELVIVNKNGFKYHCIVNCITIDYADNSNAFQGIIHDLTMRKKAERDMLIAEKLSMTGKIARTIAHEVRNPLTNLNLALGQLKEECAEKKDDVTMYLDIIQRNAQRIEQLISEMLNSSRPGELVLKHTDPACLFDEALKHSNDRMKLKGIKLSKHIQDNLPLINADQEKLKIAFLNIIINAIEAMEADKGILEVEISSVQDEIIFRISDNGKGIAKDEIVKLFDPFHTGKKNGMGLGLTSTQNILNSHKARIEVQSELGEGTTFSIFFKPIEKDVD
ncbi:MAG: ATP-binding protein [Cyclobacteriaceae bacterium]